MRTRNYRVEVRLSLRKQRMKNQMLANWNKMETGIKNNKPASIEITGFGATGKNRTPDMRFTNDNVP